MPTAARPWAVTVSTSDPHVLIDAALAESPEYDACQ